MKNINCRSIEKIPNANLFSFIDKHCKFIGHGSSRWVYRISKHQVIKLIDFENKDPGIAQNRREVFLTNRHGHLGLFSNVLWYHHSYFWVISEYACPTKFNKDRTRIEKFLIKNSKTIRSLGIEDANHEELTDQFGKINNRIVINDYGASRKILDTYYYGC